MYEAIEMKTGVICTNIVANIVLNTIVIVVIAMSPSLREDRTTLFVLSLACSDLAIGCTVMPISAVMCSYPDHPAAERYYVAAIHGFFSIWLSMTSIYNLSWISLCKMIAIIHPLRYIVLMTERRCYMLIAANWIFTLVVSPFLFIFPMKWNGELCMFQVCNKRVHWLLNFKVKPPLTVLCYYLFWEPNYFGKISCSFFEAAC